MSVTLNQLGIFDDMPIRIEVDTKDYTVEGVLRLASEQTGIDIIAQLYGDGELMKGIVILANGYSIEAQQGLKTAVKDGESVLISGFVTGG